MSKEKGQLIWKTDICKSTKALENLLKYIRKITYGEKLVKQRK